MVSFNWVSKYLTPSLLPFGISLLTVSSVASLRIFFLSSTCFLSCFIDSKEKIRVQSMVKKKMGKSSKYNYVLHIIIQKSSNINTNLYSISWISIYRSVAWIYPSPLPDILLIIVQIILKTLNSSSASSLLVLIIVLLSIFHLFCFPCVHIPPFF